MLSNCFIIIITSKVVIVSTLAVDIKFVSFKLDFINEFRLGFDNHFLIFVF